MLRSLIATAALLSALWAPASAQPQQCGERDVVLRLLAERFGEVPVAFGVTNNGALVEVLRTGPDSQGDSWTIILTSPMGLSCLVAAGQGWRAKAPSPPDPES